MQFGNAHFLNWLWGVILIGIFFSLAIKRRKNLMKVFADEKILNSIAPNFSESKLIKKHVLLIFIFIFSVLALSRPQWGFEWQEVKKQGLDILIVIDTSKSMLTQDVKPNRLKRTKLAIRDLVRKLNGDRIGLIAFSGDAFLVCPLTVDYNGFLLQLDNVDTNAVPRGGTNISKAIRESIKCYEKIQGAKYKTVIIATDGEDLEGDALSSAKSAKEKGMKIYTIGIGTQEGDLIQIKNDMGDNEFLKDNNGNFVKSRLNEKVLQEISLATGGAYIKASGVEFGLDLIYERDLSHLEKREIESKMGKRYYERFQIPLAFATLLLVVETCLNTRKK